MDIVKLALETVGLITTAVAIISFFIVVTGWLMGISPLLYRLGFGRWSRKIDIIADGDNFDSLKNDLVDTGIFREKNIRHISKSTLAKVKESNLGLVHYQSFTPTQLETILGNKKTGAGLVIYFPEFSPPTQVIPNDMLKKINDHSFTTIVNFRGRLVNDILITLLSTSYEKK